MASIPHRYFAVSVLLPALIATTISFAQQKPSTSATKTAASKKPAVNSASITKKPPVITSIAKKLPVTATTAKKPAVTASTAKRPAANTGTTSKNPAGAKPLNASVSSRSSVIPARNLNNKVQDEIITPTQREQNMINEINLLRSNPAAYCAYIGKFLEKADADREMIKAANELTMILKRMKPLPALTLNTAMYKDARRHGMLMSKNNEVEHSDLPYAENLSLGYADARDAIIDLLIDADIADRGHRKNLLSEKLKHVAVYEVPGKVQDLNNCYMQVFR